MFMIDVTIQYCGRLYLTGHLEKCTL